jgi:formylglycine-generating enzyme required for sulfatase activity
VADIFLSYPRTDRIRAETIVAAFRRLGYDVWWDADIMAGQEWTATIGRELDAAAVVVVLWTRQSVRQTVDEPNYVIREAHYALDRAKPILGLRLEKCQLPFPFTTVQCVDVFEWHGEPGHAGWTRALTDLATIARGARVAAVPVPPRAVAAGGVAALELAWQALGDDDNVERLRALLKDAGDHPLRHAIARRIEAVERSLATRPGFVFSDLPSLPSLVVVPAGEFDLGSPESEPDRDADEGPVTRVTLEKPFAIGRFPVTRREWSAFAQAVGAADIASAPAHATGDHPAVNVSWTDANAYCRWASQVSGASYRLPTEQEWEYACRAGTSTPFFTGETISTNEANFRPDGGDRPSLDWCHPTPVGLFAANAFGVYDMHGLVWEWCSDVWRPGYDPDRAAVAAGRRTLRGGSWSSPVEAARSASRSSSDLTLRSHDIGFRVVRAL